MRGQSKRSLLESVKIYLITDASPKLLPIEAFVREAIAGGTGMVQLREKHASDAELLEVSLRCASECRNARVPFIVNDRVDIALACGADGVHLGQDDLPPNAVRELAGERFIIGLSTHSPEQIDRAADLDVDYIGVGPIYETPTKEGRPAVGLALVRYAAGHAAQPFFAIGGLNPTNIGSVMDAGATGVSVLRWISASSSPRKAASELLERYEMARRTLPARRS